MHVVCGPRMTALAALDIGGPKLLQALNNAGNLPSYDTRRYVDPPPPRPSLPCLLDDLSYIAGLHLWHLCIDELHVQDVITVSRDVHAVLPAHHAIG